MPTLQMDRAAKILFSPKSCCTRISQIKHGEPMFCNLVFDSGQSDWDDSLCSLAVVSPRDMLKSESSSLQRWLSNTKKQTCKRKAQRQMLHRGFGDSAEKVLKISFVCDWHMNNCHYAHYGCHSSELFSKKYKASPTQFALSSLSTFAFLNIWLLSSCRDSFMRLSLYFVQHCLYLSHLTHLTSDLHVTWLWLWLFVCAKAACGPDSDVCIAEYFVFGWLRSNNRLLIRCVNLPLLLFCFLSAPSFFYCSVSMRCGEHC